MTVDEQTAGKIRNGMQVNVPEFSEAPLVKVFSGAAGVAVRGEEGGGDAGAAGGGAGVALRDGGVATTSLARGGGGLLRCGYLLVAFGGGVGVVVLHVAGDAVDVLQEEGQ